MGSLKRSLLLRILLMRSEGSERTEYLELLKAEQGQADSIAWDLVMGKFGGRGLMSGLSPVKYSGV